MYCVRLPYNIVVLAVGHYKQTQRSAIIEACLNLTTAIVLVLKFGLVGVAVGTLVAMIYRTCYLAWYISRNVINRSLWPFVKHLCVDAIAVAAFLGLMTKVLDPIAEITISSYIDWMIEAVKVLILGITSVGLINAVFYNRRISLLLKKKR